MWKLKLGTVTPTSVWHPTIPHLSFLAVSTTASWDSTRSLSQSSKGSLSRSLSAGKLGENCGHSKCKWTSLNFLRKKRRNPSSPGETCPKFQSHMLNNVRLFGKSMIDGLQTGRSHVHNADGTAKIPDSVVDEEILRVSLETGVLSKKTAFLAGQSTILPKIDWYNDEFSLNISCAEGSPLLTTTTTTTTIMKMRRRKRRLISHPLPPPKCILHLSLPPSNLTSHRLPSPNLTSHPLPSQKLTSHPLRVQPLQITCR